MVDENALEEWGRYNYGAPPIEQVTPPNPAENVNWTPGLVADLASEESRNPFGVKPQTGGTPPPTRQGMSEEEGRAYDAQNGLIGGYMTPNGWVSGSPRSGGGGGGGGGMGGGSGQFDYGRPPGLLNFSPYNTLPGFQVEPFGGSSWEDAEREPGFKEAQERLAKMIQNTAAYRGIVRSGATIGELGTYLDQNKGQNFQQFDARNYRNWQGNQGQRQFAYGQQVGENERFNNYRFNTEKASFDDMLSRWQELVRSTTSLARPI